MGNRERERELCLRSYDFYVQSRPLIWLSKTIERFFWFVLARDMLCICTNNYYRAYFVSFNYFIATHIVHNVHTSIAALHSHTFAHTVRPVLSMKFRGKIAMLTSLSHGTAQHIGNNTICIPNHINHIQILFEWFCLLWNFHFKPKSNRMIFFS